jgi:hypothetical protein
MKNRLQMNWILGIAFLLFVAACKKEDAVLPEQSNPQTETAATTENSNNNSSTNSNSNNNSSNTDTTTSTGNSTSTGSTTYPVNGTINFAGQTWTVRNNEMAQGPGPNSFSSSGSNVWVDGSGNLHLKITKTSNGWKCAEVISGNKYGYGTYVFTVGSDVAALNPNVVAGMFTWDDHTFATQANSEIDIEFAKWGNNGAYTYTSSVQPVKFENPDVYLERTNQPAMDINKLRGTSTHAFTWTSSLVTWKSYEGASYPGSNLIAAWQFSNTMQPRIKYEGGNQSAPVVIPAPGNDTRVHINLWLFNGQAPTDNNEVELVIKSFQFIPAAV